MGASGKREVALCSGIGEVGNSAAGLALTEPVFQRRRMVSVKVAALKAPPWWFWPGWLLHLGSYTLPSAGDGDTHKLPGYACALIAWECWFKPSELANAWQQGQSQDAIVRLLIGWFNVTNLAALLAPLLLAWPGRRSLSGWTALLCSVGVSHARAFWLGLFTGEVMPMRVGFFVWTLSYAWLAVAAYAVMRRRVVL